MAAVNRALVNKLTLNGLIWGPMTFGVAAWLAPRPVGNAVGLEWAGTHRLPTWLGFWPCVISLSPAVLSELTERLSANGCSLVWCATAPTLSPESPQGAADTYRSARVST